MAKSNRHSSKCACAQVVVGCSGAGSVSRLDARCRQLRISLTDITSVRSVLVSDSSVESGWLPCGL